MGIRMPPIRWTAPGPGKGTGGFCQSRCRWVGSRWSCKQLCMMGVMLGCSTMILWRCSLAIGFQHEAFPRAVYRVGEASHPGPNRGAARAVPPWAQWSVPVAYLDSYGKMQFELAEPDMVDVVRAERHTVHNLADQELENMFIQLEVAAGWRSDPLEDEAAQRAEQWRQWEADHAAAGTPFPR